MRSIADIFSGSCTPALELLDAVNSGIFNAADVQREIDNRFSDFSKRYTLADLAAIEYAYVYANDI